MITELTPEQEALLFVYRNKWVEIGLSTVTNKKRCRMNKLLKRVLVGLVPVLAIAILLMLYFFANIPACGYIVFALFVGPALALGLISIVVFVGLLMQIVWIVFLGPIHYLFTGKFWIGYIRGMISTYLCVFSKLTGEEMHRKLWNKVFPY